MKGIILEYLKPTQSSAFSHIRKDDFKEVSDNFDLNNFISKLKKASDKKSIVCLYYFDTENNIFEKYNKQLIKESTNPNYVLTSIREILRDNYKIELNPNKKEYEQIIDESLRKELGDYYTEDDFNFYYNSDNSLKSVTIYLSEDLINWEHSTETDEYQQYGQEAWEDDDFMEPNFDDYQELKEKLSKVLKDIDFIKKWNLDYSEKNMLILSIMFK